MTVLGKAGPAIKKHKPASKTPAKASKPAVKITQKTGGKEQALPTVNLRNRGTVAMVKTVAAEEPKKQAPAEPEKTVAQTTTSSTITPLRTLEPPVAEKPANVGVGAALGGGTSGFGSLGTGYRLR